MRTVMRYASVASMVVLLLMAVSASTGQAAGLIDLKLSGQGEPSTYLVWDLIKKGWDKEAGLKMTQTYFDSGMAQVEALPSKQWVIGTSQGGVPSLVAALRYGTYTVAIGDEDSFTNAVLVRPDSPIAKATGPTRSTPRPTARLIPSGVRPCWSQPFPRGTTPWRLGLKSSVSRRRTSLSRTWIRDRSWRPSSQAWGISRWSGNPSCSSA